MKISRKKTVGLMLLFVMLISAIMPTMATALTYSLSDGSIINSYNVTTDVVTLYIGNVSKDGTSQFRYLYTDKAVNTATLTEIGKILTSDYSGLLPTTAGQVKACSDSTIEVQDFFTDAGMVAAAKYPSGTTQDTSGIILYNQTEFNTLVANSQTEISEESAAESTNLTEWNGRKTAWEADPDNAGIDFPEEYVKAFNDPTVYPAEYFIADSKGTANTSAIIRDGSVVDVRTYPIDRTIVKVVNTSANVEATSTVSNVVSNLEELQAALNNDALTEVIVNNAMTLPNGTSLDGKGKTVRVEKPYVKEDGTLEESPSSGNVFDVGSGSEVTIKNMTIMGGQKNSSGAISSNGQLTLENVNIVRSNRGLDHYGGVSILKNCNFSLNVCKSAGAIWCGNGAKLILDGCSFTQNRSNGGSGMGGGAIGLSSGYLYANNTIFANNATQEIGGAINIYDGNAYLMNCTVAGNCSSGGNEYYGGGIGKNGGVFHAVNSVFIDNYAKVSGDKARSDIGIYSGSNGSLNNCVYSKMQGSMSSTPNCKIDESNMIASTYTDAGIMLSDGTTSTSFSHPVLTAGANPISKYVIIKASGNAATGGTLTYFDYSDKANIKMGYGNDTSITALGGLSVPSIDKKVNTYYEGGTRASGVIGASRADGEIVTSYNVTVTNDGNGTAEATPTSGTTGTEVTLTANPTDPTNYRFKEWQVISGGITINENKFNIGTSDVEVKAIFEEIIPDEFTVKFMDGNQELFNVQVANGGYVTRPTTNPTKADYIFVDWYLDDTLTTKFNFTTTAITANTFIYAKWQEEITTWAQLQAALTAGGTVTLTRDIVAESTDTTLSIPRPAVLDLNGCIIDAKGYMAPVIRLSEYSNLVIDDSNPNKEHSPAFTYKKPITNDDVVVNGGIITGGKDGNWGNGIDVPRSTLTINAGSIVGNTTTTGDGAGVFLHSGATCTMNGGLIAGNYSAGSGGGVYLYYSNTFYMTGGSIKHNTAGGKGGGVYLWNNQTGYYEEFNMSGGSIEENKSTSGGGGIYLDTRGTLNVSGNPVIIGNKNGDTDSNVYSGLNVTGRLTDGAMIGITRPYEPWPGDFIIFTNGYGTHNDDNPAKYFVGDYDNIAVVPIENYTGITEAALTLMYSVTVSNDGNGTATANATSGVQGTEVTLTANPTDPTNYRFKEWQVILGGITINENKFNIGTSDVEVKAIFEQIPSHTVTFKDGETELYTQSIKDGEYASKPTTNPTKEGYIFDDWCIDSTLTTKFVFETTPITTNTPIYARWKLLPKVLGESVWRNGGTATLRFNSNVTGTYYYDVKDSNTPPTADEIKSSLSVNSGNDSAIIGTNALDLTGISSGAKYVYIVVEQDNVFSNVLTIEMPYDSYFSDNYDSYASNTRISGLNSYSLQYNGTGTGNQIIISSEQKDGSTGNVLQLQGANSWASDVRHSVTPDDKQYVIFEANIKPVSGSDPGGVNFGSSSAGGYWTASVCRAGFGLNNKYYYGKNDTSGDCDTDLSFTNGNWYNLKMILDNTNDVYYICIDNQYIETIPYSADPATPEWFSIGGGNNGVNTIYYDDVKVYTTNTVEIPTPSYRIYVNSGTSSPSPRAEENTTVTITADEPSNGSEFYKWIVISGGVTLVNENSATTTFTMGTERVEVTALYKFVIPDQITYELRDSYGDGWHGNNKINIVDTSNNNTVESLTMSGSSRNGITQNLEPGHIYDLYWQKGSYPGECSFTLKDKDGNVLITRSGDDNASKEGIFLTVQVAEPTYYTVRFMDGETELSSEQVVEGGRVARPTTNPSKTNHIFLGWYADAALATEFDFDNTAITADTQIYAGFVKQGIFVYYNAGDGNGGTVFSDMINAGDTYNVRAFDSLTTFSAPSGKHFAGWNVSDGSQITKAQLESNPAKVINQIGNSATASITFTAYYEDDVYYTVSFMDGTNTISSQTILEGQKATRPTSDPTKANHEFVNWYADSTLTTVFNFNTLISRDMCIYAKFNPVYHDVTIPLSDGLVVPSGGGTFTEEQILGIEFLASKGIVIYEEDDAAHVERWYTADRKLLFTFDENTKTIHFADGVSYKDNINYVLTDADKTLLAGYGAYINTITLSFGNAPFEYVILEGANQTHTVNQDGSLTVKANGDISKFVKLLVDRIEVAEKDRTIVSGSTVATLSKEFLDTLSEGTHELTFVYTDGEVSTNFTIARVSMPTQTGGDVGTPVAGTPVQVLSKIPITGDNVILWIILLIIAVNGFVATEVYIRKVFKK